MSHTDTLLLKEILSELRRIAGILNAEAQTERVHVEEVRAAMRLGKTRFANIMNAMGIVPERRGGRRFITKDEVAQINHRLRDPILLQELGLSDRSEIPKPKRYARPPVRRDTTNQGE